MATYTTTDGTQVEIDLANLMDQLDEYHKEYLLSKVCTEDELKATHSSFHPIVYGLKRYISNGRGEVNQTKLRKLVDHMYVEGLVTHVIEGILKPYPVDGMRAVLWALEKLPENSQKNALSYIRDNRIGNSIFTGMRNILDTPPGNYEELIETLCSFQASALPEEDSNKIKEWLNTPEEESGLSDKAYEELCEILAKEKLDIPPLKDIEEILPETDPNKIKIRYVGAQSVDVPRRGLKTDISFLEFIQKYYGDTSDFKIFDTESKKELGLEAHVLASDIPQGVTVVPQGN